MLAGLLFLAVPSLYFAPPAILQLGAHHERHFDLLAGDAPGFNGYVLKGIDRVQSTAPAGGGYFIGVHAVPPESPVGYPLGLFGRPLLNPPRGTSYCSGSTYAAFIEGLDELYRSDPVKLDESRFEAMRMQEPDGGRREDRVKAWGWWNADGFGNDYALVQYLRMGERVKPEEARPGVFMNISWKSGLGHSVVFLGWAHTSEGSPAVLYWASQTRTNGFGDQLSALSRIRSLCVVRMTHPENLFTFDPSEPVDPKVPGDPPPSF